MRALTKFVLKDVKLNRKRSIGILIGITLSVMLICTVACIVSSYSKTMLQSDINYFGYWHISLSGIDEAKLEKLNLNRNVNMVKSVYNNYYQYTNQRTLVPSLLLNILNYNLNITINNIINNHHILYW